MAKLKLLSTIFSKLGSLTKNNGQIIVTRDSKSLYVDLEGDRIEITDWIDVNTETELLATLTPLTNKYYYTKDTNKIWRYVNGKWECLNTSVNDLTPTYTESSTLAKLSSGEKLSVSFGKISKAITDLISHIGDSVKHITSTERTNWGKAYTHSQSTHARTDATKVEKSSTNGNIKINGTETTVYTHPGGTNPHGTTKSDVGLGNVDNTADSAKSVKYATSAGSASSALKATSVVDYGSPAKTIQIGYGGDGISGDAIKYIAGYTTGNDSDVYARIKDVSKDALKSWLGLGSLAYSSATIPTVPSSLPANGGNSATVNGHTVNSDVPANAKFTDTTYALATTSANGLMSKDMVSKLNNCRREVWSSTTPSIDLNDHWIYEY